LIDSQPAIEDLGEGHLTRSEREGRRLKPHPIPADEVIEASIRLPQTLGGFGIGQGCGQGWKLQQKWSHEAAWHSPFLSLTIRRPW
jgi:hypothetical protein